jgi:hypothetical protein
MQLQKELSAGSERDGNTPTPVSPLGELFQ